MLLEKVQDQINLKNKMVVGFELNNEYSQLSFCAFDQSMPDTLSLVTGQEEYNIPTALLARKKLMPDGSEQIAWSVGREIRKQQENGVLIDNILEAANSDRNIFVDGREFEIADILGIYIKKCLALLMSIGRREEIVAISFTTTDLSQKIIQILKNAIKEVPVYFLDKQECFYQYMIHQPSEIRIHDCLLFELDDEGLKTFKLESNPITKPVVFMIDEGRYDTLSFVTNMSENEKELYDIEFEKIIKEITDGKIVSSSFLIGDGFSKEWCKASLKELCRHGRVFQGNNLYSKGACYHAREKISSSTLVSENVFLGEDKIRVNVGMAVQDRGENRYLPLLHAGTNWYDASFEQELILAYDNTLHLQIVPVDGAKVKTADITLEYFQIRKNHTNRILLKLEMKTKSIIHIEITDLGFGEIFPSKRSVWKEDIDINKIG